mmetsp:Transcript_24629/g.33764  ORF Transcript_24629/g.33764 Transcript_24629/m.33764 type:complete len:150 (-) Transcript_24629:918-1367(-)
MPSMTADEVIVHDSRAIAEKVFQYQWFSAEIEISIHFQNADGGGFNNATTLLKIIFLGLFMNPIGFEIFPAFQVTINGHGCNAAIRSSNNHLLKGGIADITNREDSWTRCCHLFIHCHATIFVHFNRRSVNKISDWFGTGNIDENTFDR